MSAMGMDKSGNTAIAGSSAWVKVTVLVARSGYPATVITNNALVVDTGGDYSVTWRGSFVFDSGTQNFRVVRNGSTVLGTVATNTVGTVATVTLAAGDTIELQGQTSAFSGTGTQVEGGAANTYVYITPLSTPHTAEATQDIAWGRTATAAISAGVAAADTAVQWGRTAELSQETRVSAARDIQWDVSADLYPGEHYTADTARDIQWSTEASLLHTPKIVTPPSVFTFADITVSVHTIDGKAVGDFPCRLITAYSWGREATEVSTCTIDVATQGDPELVEQLRQWVHWITVWFDDDAVWTGPIQNIRITRSTTTISARDPSTFMWRTRVPVTKRFTDTDPSRIADSLWQAMNQHHGIRATPLVLPGIAEDTFTIDAVADSRMLHQLMDELVKIGLRWTVVGGRPVLGQFPRQPVAELYECDFMVELERRRDGTQTFNDVRVQGQNWAQTAIADLAGLKLQTLVSIDDLFGSSNIQRAAQQYARESATLRDELVVPSNASLHPQAPVTMDDLVPGKVFAVHYETFSQLMRLDQMTCAGSPEAFDVQVSLVALEQTGDVARLVGGSDA